MSFLEELESLFGKRSLYEVLGVPNTASESDIKRAYRRLSLNVHPDRVKEDEKEIATKKFQALCKVHSVLSNKELRSLYDETGEVGEEVVVQERDWVYYWRLMFPKITTEDITKFENEYKGSDEEVKDLKAAYLKFEGDMESILENVLCTTMDDDGRFRDILKTFIESGELPKFDSFTKDDRKKKKARKEKAKREAVEAEKSAQELGLHGKDNDLAAMIMKRQTNRQSEMNSFLAGLEGKYCPEKTNSKKRKASKAKK